MNKQLVWLAVALTVVTGCSRGVSSHTTTVTPPATPVQEPVQQQTGTDKTTTALTPVPEKPRGEDTPIKDSELVSKVADYLKNQGIALSQGEPHLYRTHLGPVPARYDHIVMATAEFQAYLFGTDVAEHQIGYISKLDDAIVNTVKTSVVSDQSHVWFWSQAPFRATEKRTVAEWDGTRLQILSSEVADPTAEHFDRLAAFVAEGNLDGVMKEGGNYLYPRSYPGYFTLPPAILKLAYKQSLEVYKAGDLTGALRRLEYGIDQYALVYGQPLGTDQPHSDFTEERLTETELVPIVNDYAFFLAESGKQSEAKPLLLRVVKVAPDRTVAYLNLADVQWDLGEKENAKANYRKYLDLMGPHREEAPKRALERSS